MTQLRRVSSIGAKSKFVSDTLHACTYMYNICIYNKWVVCVMVNSRYIVDMYIYICIYIQGVQPPIGFLDIDSHFAWSYDHNCIYEEEGNSNIYHAIAEISSTTTNDIYTRSVVYCMDLLILKDNWGI